MKNKKFMRLLLSLSVVLIIALAGCAPQIATPEATEPPAPTEAPEPEPSVTVSDQAIEMDSVTVDEVVAAENGWIVIHAEADGAPGPVIGHAAIEAGSNTGVQVSIDREAVTQTLYAMLHVDSGGEGEYEFPEGDPPVSVEDQIVVTPFTVENAGEAMEPVPSVTVSDQMIEMESVTVDEVVATQDGWIVIHAEADGAPGPVIGHAAVESGMNTDVQVSIDSQAATETLYAMLHVDTGAEGEYEFPDADPPVMMDEQIVVMPFSVEGMATEAESAEVASAAVSIVDNEFQPAEISVSPGTTVTWTNEGSLRHTVTDDGGMFDSGAVSPGGTFEFTFEEAGTYPYHCTFHGGPGGVGMAAVITVE